MPSIKDYNVTLASLKNTQKITKTMKMVSASKLRRAQEAQRNARLYENRLNGLISRMVASLGTGSDHPLLQTSPNVKKVLVIVFTSDRGLCGGFNNNLCKYVYNWIKDQRNNGLEVDVSCCGRRGNTFFKRRATIKKHYEDVTNSPEFFTAIEIGNHMIDYFKADEYDEIYVARNIFVSALSQDPTINKLLPVGSELIDDEQSAFSGEYIFEPQQEELLEMLVPRSIYFNIYYTFLENSAGEHGARMTAMDSAAKNASDLIENYTLLRNRARQAAITTELTEIVAGAEAL